MRAVPESPISDSEEDYCQQQLAEQINRMKKLCVTLNKGAPRARLWMENELSGHANGGKGKLQGWYRLSQAHW